VTPLIHCLKNATTGLPVQSQSLRAFAWTYNAGDSNTLTNSTAGIYVFVYDGNTLPPSSLQVQLQYIVTTVGGVLNVLDGVLVTPRAVESVISISGWPYEDPENHLSLRTAVGSVQGSWSSSGLLVAGGGDGAVYFRFSGKAQIDGSLKTVTVGAAVLGDSTTFGNPYVTAQLQGRYSGNAAVHTVDVDFPAGASIIIYDPAMGSGSSPYPADDSSNSNLSLIIGLSVGLGVLVIIVVIVFGVFVAKRAGYDTVH